MDQIIKAFQLLVILAVSNVNAQIKVASGTLQTFSEFKSVFVAPRDVYVWLPSDYSQKYKYDVVYMHDGQMLFDAETTWNKQEWKADETAGKLIAEGKTRKFIIVGIASIGNLRHSEYFPQKAFELLPKMQQDSIVESNTGLKSGKFTSALNADNYLKFIVTELKPFIDKTFSVNSGRDQTFVAGSSMGGLISLYAICEYPEVFGGAACISTHWPGIFSTKNNPIPGAFFQYMEQKLPSPATHKLYFDYGNKTLDELYEPYQLQADKIMVRKGFNSRNWMTKAFYGADHSEKSWADRLDIPLLFLMAK